VDEILVRVVVAGGGGPGVAVDGKDRPSPDAAHGVDDE